MVNELQELRDLEWLGNVSIASAAEEFRFVSRHGERGDSDDWNCARLLIRLDKTSCLHSRNIGKLNVHQDEVGLVSAGEFDSLFSQACRENFIALVFKQVVEKFKVEIVVLNNSA